MKKQNKIDWLSVLQGWSMLLVVIGHINLTNGVNDYATPISSTAMEIQHIIYSFHMPLFMLISGFLFYFTQIRKEKPYKETVIAKLKRLGVPFLFFTLTCILLKFAFNPFMKRPVEFSYRIITDSFFITSGGNPLGEMWFIFTLLILFLFYPLYTFVLRKPAYMIVFFFIAILFNLLFPTDINFLCLSKVAKYLIFFYAGILISKYEFYKKLDSWLVFAVCLIIFAFLWIVKTPQIIMSFAGIAASFSLCLCLAHGLPNLFSSFRDYTFQIFLIGIFPQIAIRFLFTKTAGEIHYNTLYILLYMTSILTALYIPVLIAKIVEKIPYKWIRICFGLS